jgi:trans-aconitate methyltransferase
MLTHYDNKQAREYDTRSEFDKGDRQRQGHYLLEAVGFSGRPVHRFIELGCGTGYFSELVLKAFPSAQGLLIDDSEAMLTEARRRLAAFSNQVTCLCQRIEAAPSAAGWESVDLVLCAMTLHLLTPAARRRSLELACEALGDGGILVLIGRFLATDAEHARLLEYLGCSDMRRRMQAVFGPASVASPEMQLARVIQRDRQREAEEPNAHMSIEEYVELAKECGFRSAHVMFQEARIFGLLAVKAQRGAD